MFSQMFSYHISVSDEDFYIGCVLDYSDMFKYFGTGSLCDDTSGCAALGDSFMALGPAVRVIYNI